MFSRTALAAVLFAGLGLTASAQVESDSLGDLSAWGQRYLSSNETEFPIDLWHKSDDDTLLLLLQSVQTTALSPAERELLRRTVLSPATPPRGIKSEDILAERARLMLELGEARAAAALVPQLKQDEDGPDAETLAVDLEMASGQEATACSRLDGSVNQGDYWLKLRAVCAILQDNISGAQLAIEFAAAQGVTDEWMVEAIFAAAGDTPNPPGARFDSGLNIALSAKAVLDLSSITIAEDRPGLAAAAAQRPGIPADLRARFAEQASELDLLDPEIRRNILLARLDDPDYAPSTLLEQALKDLNDPLSLDEQRAVGLAAVLQTAARSDLRQYRSTAQLFLTDLRRLPQNPTTAEFALDYARAALMAGDRELAQSWMTTLNFEGAPQPDPYLLALLDAVDIIVGGDRSQASLRAVEKRLVNTADTAQRESQAVRVFTLWTGLGLPLSPIARDFVSQTADRGIRLPEGQLTSLRAAAQSGAIGETALMVLALTNGQASEIADPDLANLLSILISIDAETVAQNLAMETIGYWKAEE